MRIPDQEYGTVEMVSVEWLLQNIHYSVDGCNDENDEIDFARLLRNKNDGALADVVYTIQERGFRVPICLYPNPYGVDWALGNGHHRMTASILMCLGEIPVYWSEAGYMASHTTDTENVLNSPDDGFGEFLHPFLPPYRPLYS